MKKTEKQALMVLDKFLDWKAPSTVICEALITRMDETLKIMEKYNPKSLEEFLEIANKK